MNRFDYNKTPPERIRYDEVRDFCRCERINEAFFRTQIRKREHKMPRTTKKGFWGRACALIGIAGYLAALAAAVYSAIHKQVTAANWRTSIVSGSGLTTLLVFSSVSLLLGLIIMRAVHPGRKGKQKGKSAW